MTSQDKIAVIREMVREEIKNERKLVTQMETLSDRMYHLGRAHAYELVLEEIDT